MNYFQRLIRRINAETHLRTSAVSDPFSNAQIEEAVWPDSTAQADHTRTSHVRPQKIDESKTKEQQPSFIDQNTTTAEPSKVLEKQVAHSEKVSTQIITHEKEKIITEEKNSPTILNEHSSISIIDQMMEPFIESAEHAFKGEPPTKQRSVSSKRTQAARKSTHLNPKIQPIETIANVQEGKAVAEQQAIPSISPTKPYEPSVESPTDNQPKSAEPKAEGAKVTQANKAQETMKERMIQQRTEYVVVNATQSSAHDSTELVSGAPGIGIGQL